MTPSELKSIRRSLGLSAEAFARLVRVASGRAVRRWEAGDRDIPGPVEVIAEGLRDSSLLRAHFGVSIISE
jgi:DNA-binding transcriptional regulator YiaG